MPSNDHAIDARYVEKICVINQGAFVLNFKVAEKVENSTKDVEGSSSDNYPVAVSHTVNLTSLEKRPEIGTEILPIISVVLGHTVNGPSVLYAPNGQTATYLVTGMTLHVNVALT